MRIRITLLAMAICVGLWETLPAAWSQTESPEQQVSALVGSGYQAMQEERLQEAERYFFQALRLERDHKQARFGLGTLYIKMNNYERAIRVLESVLAQYPDEYFVLNNLAWLYATASDVAFRDGERAVKLAQEALLLQPNDFHVWSTLSEGHYIMGEYNRALRAAREALRISRQANAPETRIDEYRRQVDRSQRAAEALTILD